MESLIPFIIMLILGSLFKGKGKKPSEDERQPKPSTAQRKEQDNPLKKLKEMSRDLYKEIQQELEQETKKTEQRPVVIPKTVVQKVEAKAEPIKPIEKKRRVETHRDEVKRQKVRKPSKVANASIVPKSSDDIMKGIIFSEIIGPPKSRR